MEARRNHLQGVMLLELLIRPDGAVTDVRVLKSSGHKILDRSAVRGFRRWRFVPDGTPRARAIVGYSLHCRELLGHGP